MPRKRESKSLLQFLIDFVFFCLMILGVGGVMFKILMPEGWLETWLHDIWKIRPGYALVTLCAALVAFLLAKRWIDGFSVKTSLGDMIMYGWMLLGLFFGVRLLVTGSL